MTRNMKRVVETLYMSHVNLDMLPSFAAKNSQTDIYEGKVQIERQSGMRHA